MTYELHLAHHGVDGQKWGVRNGPPYPLFRNSKKRRLERRREKILDRKKDHYKKYAINTALSSAVWNVGVEQRNNLKNAKSISSARGETLNRYLGKKITEIAVGTAAETLVAVLLTKKLDDVLLKRIDKKLNKMENKK